MAVDTCAASSFSLFTLSRVIMFENLATNIIAAAIFAFLGIAILGIALWIFDRITPGTLWKELIEDQNTAIAIVLAGLTIGISIIIAAAVH